MAITLTKDSRAIRLVTGRQSIALSKDSRSLVVKTVSIGSGGGAPDPHATTHENSGSDEVNVDGLSGLLADPQTPDTHVTTHQNGGSDELSVAGLSGELADPQVPKLHASTHTDGGADELIVEVFATAGTIGTVPTSDGAGGLSMQTPGGGGTPGGNNATIQYNNAGSFDGSPYITFNGAYLTISDPIKFMSHGSAGGTTLRGGFAALADSLYSTAWGYNARVLSSPTIPAAAATGSTVVTVPFTGVPAGWDGNTITIGDGATSVTFELDNNSSVTPGNVAVPFVTGDLFVNLGNSFGLAIFLSGLNISLVDGGSYFTGGFGGVLLGALTNNAPGIAGNVLMTSTGFSVPAEFSSTGMSGGSDAVPGVASTYGSAWGNAATCQAVDGIAGGRSSSVVAQYGIAWGYGTDVLTGHTHSVALGAWAQTTAAHRLNVGTIGGSNAMDLQIGKGIGVWGSTPPPSKPTVTGSRGGNAALASLLTAIAATGLITNSTTA